MLIKFNHAWSGQSSQSPCLASYTLTMHAITWYNIQKSCIVSRMQAIIYSKKWHVSKICIKLLGPCSRASYDVTQALDWSRCNLHEKTGPAKYCHETVVGMSSLLGLNGDGFTDCGSPVCWLDKIINKQNKWSLWCQYNIKPASLTVVLRYISIGSMPRISLLTAGVAYIRVFIFD